MEKGKAALLLLLGIFILAGCAQTVGSRPEDRLNPAMTPLTKSAKLNPHAKSAQN